MADQTKAQQIAQYNADKTEPPKPLNQGTPPADQTVKGSNTDVIKQKALDTKEKKRVEKLEQEEADKKAQEERERNATILETATIQAENANNAVTGAIDKPRKFIENLPTPGGIATVVIILLFFTFAAVPVNAAGDTRLKLMWLTLVGRTKLVNNVGTAKSSGRVVAKPAVLPVKEVKTPVPIFQDVPVSDVTDVLSLLDFKF